MFKRLFFLSGIIAFLLACGTMYFWYLPSQQPTQSTIVPEEVETELSAQTDSLTTELPAK